MDYHQSAQQTLDKPIWITEYGVLSDYKAESAARVTTGLMEPLADWIGHTEHRYTGVSWFMTQIEPNDDVTEHTELLQETPMPFSTLKAPLGTTWSSYSDLFYPPTETP